MKRCFIRGCGRSPYPYAKEYCRKHRTQLRNYGSVFDPKWITCEYFGCAERMFYSRRPEKNAPVFCRWHYYRISVGFCKFKKCDNTRLGSGSPYCTTHKLQKDKKFKLHVPHAKKCDAETCQKTIQCNELNHGKCVKYCGFHYERFKKGIPFDRPIGVKGELNPRWNGGISEYPNHYLFKKNRLIKLKEAKYKCKECNKKKNIEVHHKNEDKSDHRLENLRVMCHSCHVRKYHSKPKKTSKFIRLYGKTLKALGEMHGVSGHKIYYMIRRGFQPV